MELPFTIVFEPPGRADLIGVGAGLRRARVWVRAGLAGLVAVALGLAGWWTAGGASIGDGATSVRGTPLVITSRPAGARVSVDGREQGRTPLSLLLPPGERELTVSAAGALEGRYRLRLGEAGARLDARLWRRQPIVSRLRPTLPGATLTGVEPLADGRLALSVGVPPGGEAQAWLFEPASGQLERLLTPGARGRLAVAPDASRVAFVAATEARTEPLTGPDPPEAVWLTLVASGALRPIWRPASASTHIVDLAWAPDGRRLLVAAMGERPDGGVRTRLWLLDVDGGGGQAVLTRELVVLPSLHVAGSAVWSPDGQRVVFVARAGSVRALCVIDLGDGPGGEFRYLSELGEAEFEPAAAPYPPVAWQADGHRLLYVAPAQDQPNGPFGWLDRRPRRMLYLVGAEDLVPRAVGPLEADLAAWREDASLVLLGRVKDPDGPLVLRSADAALGDTRYLLELPLRPPLGYATRWDLGHARLLIASPTGRDQLDYWLVRLGLDEED